MSPNAGSAAVIAVADRHFDDTPNRASRTPSQTLGQVSDACLQEAQSGPNHVPIDLTLRASSRRFPADRAVSQDGAPDCDLVRASPSTIDSTWRALSLMPSRHPRTWSRSRLSYPAATEPAKPDNSLVMVNSSEVISPPQHTKIGPFRQQPLHQPTAPHRRERVGYPTVADRHLWATEECRALGTACPLNWAVP